MAVGDGIDRRRAEVRKRIAALDRQICKDAAEFNRVMAEIIKLKIEGDALFFVKTCVVECFSNIVQKTPVDTGRARASWTFGIGSEPLAKMPPGQYPDFQGDTIDAAIEKHKSAIQSAPSDVAWYISNHLEYIEALEVGWSKQQPQGMVRLALQELTAKLQRYANNA